VGCCECGNEPSATIKSGKVVGQFTAFQEGLIAMVLDYFWIFFFLSDLGGFAILDHLITLGRCWILIYHFFVLLGCYLHGNGRLKAM
jgi:hypothetical protein